MKYFWELDGDAGEQIAGRNGTVTGAVSFEAGKIKQCANFNGGYIRISAVTTENVSMYALSLWIKISQPGSAKSPMVFKGTSNVFSGIRVSADGDGAHLAFQSNGAFALGINIYDIANWHHYVFQFSAPDNLSQIFCDATLLAQSTGQGAAQIDAGYAYIGYDAAVSTRNFVGCLEQVAMWNRILSDAEILKLYGKGRGLKY
jgi:hypothetical protein